MVITKLELKDWGKHETFSADLVPGVVGILGENGSGKSTILNAIKFAFDGNLKGANKRRIRGFGQPGGATSAEVKLTFLKDGREGVITKRITATTTARSLTWNGETITAAKAVQELLSQLFGADQASILGAIFIDQGTSDAIVTAGPAVRLELFNDMLNLHYLAPRATQLQAEINKLESGLVDYGEALALTTAELEAAKVKDAAVRAELAAMPDVSDSLKLVRDYTTDLETLRREESKLLAAQQRSGELKLRCKSLLSDALVASKDDLADHLDRKKKRVADIKALLEQREAAMARQAHKKQLQASLEQNRSVLDLALKEHADITSHLSVDDPQKFEQEAQEIQRLKSAHETAAYRQATYAREKSNYDNSEASLREAIDKGNRISPMLQPLGASYQNKMAEFTAARTIATGKLEIVRNIRDSAETQTCPLCRQAVANAVLPSETTILDEISRIDGDVAKLTATYTERREAFEKVVRTGSEAQVTLSSLSAALMVAENAWNDVRSGFLSEAQVAELEARSVSNKAALSLYQEMKSRAAASSAKISGIKSQIETLEQTLATYDTGDIPEVSGDVLREKTDLEAYIEAHDQILRTVTDLDAATCASEHTANSIQDAIAVLNQKVADRFPAVQAIWESLQLSVTLHNSEAVVARLEQQGAAMYTKQGEVAAAELHLQEALMRAADIREKIDRDQTVRTMVADLKLVKEAISNSGAPGDYVQYIFERVVRRTQDLIGHMGLDLEISVDPNTPVSIRFQRTDDDSGYEFEQDQLSGGQAGRLAIAFLIAIQKELLSDVGFMILDEPTKHCSQLGVEQLGSLFRLVRQLLSDTETQIIVVDHHAALNAAFDHTISLT